MKSELFPLCIYKIILSTVLTISLPNSDRDWAAEPAFLNNGVTAHRGYSAKYPENTLLSFREGIKVGADWLECDVYKTKDGQLVVIHDPTTGRVGDRNLLVNNVTYDDLKQIDIAHGFRQSRKQSLKQCPAQRIPLLSDVIALVIRQQKTRLSLHVKDRCAPDVLAMADRMAAVPWIGFNGDDLQLLTAAKQFDPAIPVFWDRGSNSDIDADIQIARRHGFDALIVHLDGLTQAKVAKLHAAGLAVGAWTVPDAAQMRRLLLLGVDRLYVDDPALLLQVKTQLTKN
jgi:glycerophosphoryl diester phosphodiesterase